MVDILDCLVEGRQVLFFKVTPKRRVASEAVSMKLRYVMKRAWFTCLEISNTSEESWRDEQRFMYLRLRRLVGSVNEHLFENLHYEHELLLQVISFSLKSEMNRRIILKTSLYCPFSFRYLCHFP